jgi:hypothetical protein
VLCGQRVALIATAERQNGQSLVNARWYLFFALQAIHLADEHEYYKGDNQEVEPRVEEDAVINRGRTRSFRLISRIPNGL